MTVPAVPTDREALAESIREYVAELQLHMTLQARNLVPTITQSQDPRQQMLHETQAILEKLVSRQIL